MLVKLKPLNFLRFIYSIYCQHKSLISRSHGSKLSAFKKVVKTTAGLKTRKKRDLSDFVCDVVVGAGQVSLSISETADLLGFSCTTTSRVYKNCPKRVTIK